MAHELELNQNGEARMFYVGKAPWRGLGTPLEREVTSTAAIRFAQLDWTVEKQDLFALNKKIDTHQAIVRQFDDKVLGIVGSTYEPIQNSQVFEFADALVGEGLAMYHTAGSLFGGRRIFIACKLPSSLHIGPDQIDKYLVLASGHDGSMALHIKWTPIRVVCWNTLSAAFGIRGGKVATGGDTVSIRHTLNFKDRLGEARQILGLTDLYYSRIEECFNRLLQTPMQMPEFQDFSKVLYPDTKDDKTTDQKIASAQALKTRETLAKLFVDGVGNSQADVRFTRWAALNAVTEYVDHIRGTRVSANEEDHRDSVKMNSVIWGAGADTKKRALAMLAN